MKHTGFAFVRLLEPAELEPATSDRRKLRLCQCVRDALEPLACARAGVTTAAGKKNILAVIECKLLLGPR
jgi:hypothetical protein